MSKRNNYGPAEKQSILSKILEIFVIVLVIGVFIAGIFGLGTLFTPNTGTTEIHATYIAGAAGQFGEKDGVMIDDSKSIITKDLILCNSFRVTPKFTSVVTYKVHFWGEDQVYIGYVTNTENSYFVSANDMPCLKLDAEGNPIYNLDSEAYKDAVASEDAPVAIGIRVEIRPDSAKEGHFNNTWYDVQNHITKASFANDMIITITQRK